MAGGLRVDGVAGGLEGGEGVEAGEDVVEHESNLLLRGEPVECALLQAGEGSVGGGEDGKAVVGIVELALDLLTYSSVPEEAEEGRVVIGLLENGGEVEATAARRGRGGGSTGGRCCGGGGNGGGCSA